MGESGLANPVRFHQTDGGHAIEGGIQRPYGALMFRRQHSNQEIRKPEPMTGRRRPFDPGIDEGPSRGTRVEDRKGGEDPAKADAVLGGGSREDLDANWSGQSDLVRIQEMA